jgi:hypothetical protein
MTSHWFVAKRYWPLAFSSGVALANCCHHFLKKQMALANRQLLTTTATTLPSKLERQKLARRRPIPSSKLWAQRRAKTCSRNCGFAFLRQAEGPATLQTKAQARPSSTQVSMAWRRRYRQCC